MNNVAMSHPGAADYDAIVSFPGFSLGVCSDDEVIVAIDFLAPCDERPGRRPLAQAAVRQLRAYLKDPQFAFSLPLAPAGTDFQRKVWQGIAAIKPGMTCTYGELAAKVSSSPRAVGNACGANPYPLVVPCHRVVAANHGLGGFARQRGGFSSDITPASGHESSLKLRFLLDVKRWLLQHEADSRGR